MTFEKKKKKKTKNASTSSVALFPTRREQLIIFVTLDFESAPSFFFVVSPKKKNREIFPAEGKNDNSGTTTFVVGRGRREDTRGVASNAEMLHFLERNQDFFKSNRPINSAGVYTRGKFPIAEIARRCEKRPNALNVPFERTKKRLRGANAEDILQTFEKDRAIITHCGGGGRGQKSKEWLEKEGFTNVVNGGGPRVKALWEMFGHL